MRKGARMHDIHCGPNPTSLSFQENWLFNGDVTSKWMNHINCKFCYYVNRFVYFFPNFRLQKPNALKTGMPRWIARTFN